MTSLNDTSRWSLVDLTRKTLFWFPTQIGHCCSQLPTSDAQLYRQQSQSVIILRSNWTRCNQLSLAIEYLNSWMIIIITTSFTRNYKLDIFRWTECLCSICVLTLQHERQHPMEWRFPQKSSKRSGFLFAMMLITVGPSYRFYESSYPNLFWGTLTIVQYTKPPR